MSSEARRSDRAKVAGAPMGLSDPVQRPSGSASARGSEPSTNPPAAAPHPPILCPECKTSDTFTAVPQRIGLVYAGNGIQGVPKEAPRFKCCDDVCGAEFTVEQSGIVSHGKPA